MNLFCIKCIGDVWLIISWKSNKFLNPEYTDEQCLWFGLKQALYYFTLMCMYTHMHVWVHVTVYHVGGLRHSWGSAYPHHHSHFDLQYSWVFSLYALSKGMVRNTPGIWYADLSIIIKMCNFNHEI